MFRRSLISAAVLIVLAIAAAAPAPAVATAPCQVHYCTDATGTYTLSVPPANYLPIPENYRDCVWPVHVDFDDGTTGDYVYDGKTGLTGSHTFPYRGVTYDVAIHILPGQHEPKGTPESCPEYRIDVEVRYRTEEEEADAPAGPEEGVHDPGGGTNPSGGQSGTGAAGGQLGTTAPTGDAPSRSKHVREVKAYWQSCSGRGQTLVHMVGCRAGRAITHAAAARLGGSRGVEVRGFACRRNAPEGPIVCARGAQRARYSPAG